MFKFYILHLNLLNIPMNLYVLLELFHGLLTDREIDYSRDEWLNYSLDNIDEKWYIKEKKEDDSGNECIIYHRIDYYWNKVLGITTMDGRLKYPTLSKLIKNVLIIPHGNADIERGFSINENIVPQNRSLLSDIID